MILDFGSFIINESSLKDLKKDVHGVLNMSARKRMRKELRDNIITFKFKKRNGEIRTAHGTLHPDYLPKLKGGAPRPERQMVYYDLDKEGWRSFRSYSFIKIVNLEPVTSSTPKPHTKPIEKEEEEEDIKKTKPIEKEEEKVEKEVKKPVTKKKDEDEEEEHAYKSPIYDESEDEKKERKEDDEKIEKIKHKDKEEPEDEDKEDIEKEDKKDKEEKSEDE